MADQDHGSRVRLQRPGEPALRLGAGDRVERGERLVQRQHRLAGDEGPQERDPLAHAAGELVRLRPLEAPQAEAGEGLGRAAPCLSPAQAGVPQRQRGVVERREPGEEQVALGHEGASREALAGRRAPPTSIVPRARLAQAADQLEQGRLAAPRGADDAEDAVRAATSRSRRSIVSQLAVGVPQSAHRDAAPGLAAAGEPLAAANPWLSWPSWYPGALRAPDQEGQESR